MSQPAVKYYDSTSGTWKYLLQGPQGPQGPAGAGNVSGPGSSTDNAVTRFDGTTGQLIQNSVVTISDTGDIENTTGDMNVSSGNVSSGSTTGGYLGLSAGNANSPGTGRGGDAELVSGSSASSRGGDVSIHGGNGATTGGNVYAHGGNGSTGNGNVIVGNPGYLLLQKTGASTNATISVDNITAARTFSFPDAAGNVVIDSATQTLAGKTLTTPTIASFTNATHNHTNAAGGGQITDAALSSAVTVAKGGTGLTALTNNTFLTASSTSTVASTKVAPAGTVVGTTDTQALTNKRVTKRSGTASAPGATPTLNTDNYDVYTFTGVAAAITSMTTNLSGAPVVGDELMLGFKDAGSAKTITWGASFKSSGVATLLATTVANKQHWVKLFYDGSSWVCIAVDPVGY